MHDLNRQTFLRIGLGATAAAAFVPSLLAKEAASKAKAKAVIMLFMDGGPSQIDTFDPKPGKSTGGPFKAIDTAVPGIQICEHMPKLGKQMRDLSIIRSMTSKEGDHNRGKYLIHTAHAPQGAFVRPAVGCYVGHETGEPEATLPNYISVVAPLFSAAFLKSRHAPYPVRRPGHPIQNIKYARGVDSQRFKNRTDLLSKLEDEFEKLHATAYQQGRRESYREADKLMHTPDLRAFDLSSEDDKLRRAYGRNPFGQGCLLARRLVERGVKFVEVGLGGWDTHQDNFNRSRRLVNVLDPAFATLIHDLKQRGLLDETLVVWLGEFGREPHINEYTGRHHWPACFCTVLAGGGIQGGRVVGKTDSLGEAVAKRPVTVQDFYATMYSCLGVDTQKEFMDESGRPIQILDKGEPTLELF